MVEFLLQLDSVNRVCPVQLLQVLSDS